MSVVSRGYSVVSCVQIQILAGELVHLYKDLAVIDRAVKRVFLSTFFGTLAPDTHYK